VLPPNPPLPVVLRVEVKLTVFQLKELLCGTLKAGLPPQRIQLSYNGGMLLDQRTLAFFNIPDQAKLVFSVIPVGF